MVNSDREAFDLVLRRLEHDVGTLVNLVVGNLPRYTPNWAMCRMMFPVAEALGDLIHARQNTVANLKGILEREFEAERRGAYAGKAACIALLYRHGLTHTDKMRSLVSQGRTVTWQISINDRPNHCRLTKEGTGLYRLQFDTTAFYDDLVAVCRTATRRDWGGKAMNRHNSWFMLDLDHLPKDPSATKRETIQEIASFPQ